MYEARRLSPDPTGGRVVRTGRTPAYVLLFGLAFIFLPFTKAFTIDVGFPLKIYELLFIASVPAFVLERGRLRIGTVSHLLWPLAIFWLVSVGSFFAFAYADAGYLGPDFRGGAALDGLSRVAYLLLNLGIFAMIISRPLATATPLLTLCWLIGCTLSTFYSVYCVFSFMFVGEPVLLPGLDRHQLGAFGPIVVSRSGTFEEGNFGGLYFLLSAVIALHNRSLIFAGIAIVGLILTKSTSAYFAIIALFGSYYMLSRKNLLVLVPYFIALCVAAFGLFVYFAEQGKFEATGSASGAVRFNEAMTGVNMWQSSPVYGVGLGQYGFNYFRYVWDMSIADAVLSERHIASNIYVEILSELGLLGLLAIGLFWVRWMRGVGASRPHSNLLYASAVAMMVAFLAYPTFNIAFLWAYLGMALVLARSSPVRRGDLPWIADGRSSR
jgi:O-antigen ligase